MKIKFDSENTLYNLPDAFSFWLLPNISYFYADPKRNVYIQGHAIKISWLFWQIWIEFRPTTLPA